MQRIAQIWDEPVMEGTEVFDRDLPGQCKICSHRSVFCLCSLYTVYSIVLLHEI